MIRIIALSSRIATAALVTSTFLPFAAHSQTPDPKERPSYLDTSLPLPARVDDLLGRMTLEEKVSQLVNQSRAIPRLQVPSYDWWSEALHGVAGPGFATVFPEPIGLAATFDARLIHDVATATGTEGRARHNMAVRAGRRDLLEGLDFWAPNVNIFRDPRWGRGQETYGEDPFLTSRMAVAFVTGLQGDDPTYLRAIATPKHFAAHSGPEPLRHTIDVSVSKHDLEDTYLPAFRAAVVEGKAGSVMCAYNSVNGVPACANSVLLNDYLRGAWKFDGYVVGDCDAVDEILSEHHYTKNIVEAAAISLKAGVDNECVDSYAPATDSLDYIKYLDAVTQGLVSESDVDRSVRRLLAARFKLGEFDPPQQVPYAQTPDSEDDSPAHRALALTAARESMVLLKNDGVLPLNLRIKKIAVVGALADSVEVLKGNYSARPSRVVSILEGIRAEFPAAQVIFQPGVNFQREETLVPAEAFTTDEGQPGLAAAYFDNEHFTGSPILVRVDNHPNLEALPAGKDSLIQPDGLKEYSVRWTGYLTSAVDGDFQLDATGYTNKLWLDGNIVLDNSFENRDGDRIAVLKLEKGHRYRFKLECAVQDDLGARLLWSRQLDQPLMAALAAANRRRRGDCRRRYHFSTRRRRTARESTRIQGRRSNQHRLASGRGRPPRSCPSHRQTADRRADQRQRTRRELGKRSCQRHPGRLVSRRRRRNSRRTDALRPQQPRRPPPADLLQKHDAIACLRRLLHAGPYVSLFHRRPTLSIRIWIELFVVHVHEPSAVVLEAPRRRWLRRRSRHHQHQPP